MRRDGIKENIQKTVAITQALGNGGLGKSGNERYENRMVPLETDS